MIQAAFKCPTYLQENQLFLFLFNDASVDFYKRLRTGHEINNAHLVLSFLKDITDFKYILYYYEFNLNFVSFRSIFYNVFF